MNHVCSNKAETIHSRMYNAFMDKVKDRHKIIYDEYSKIIDEIVEKHPEYGNYFFDAVIGRYGGWTRTCERNESGRLDLYMVKQ